MKKPPKMSKADRQVQEASDAATWDAIEAYRDTGEMVPTERDGKLVFLTVDEALRTRDDYDRRRRETGDWRLKNLLAQFAAEGQPVPPDVWDRLEADRRQALADDLAWIERGRAAAREGRGDNCRTPSRTAAVPAVGVVTSPPHTGVCRRDGGSTGHCNRPESRKGTE